MFLMSDVAQSEEPFVHVLLIDLVTVRACVSADPYLGLDTAFRKDIAYLCIDRIDDKEIDNGGCGAGFIVAVLDGNDCLSVWRVIVDHNVGKLVKAFAGGVAVVLLFVDHIRKLGAGDCDQRDVVRFAVFGGIDRNRIDSVRIDLEHHIPLFYAIVTHDLVGVSYNSLIPTGSAVLAGESGIENGIGTAKLSGSVAHFNRGHIRMSPRSKDMEHSPLFDGVGNDRCGFIDVFGLFLYHALQRGGNFVKEISCGIHFDRPPCITDV